MNLARIRTWAAYGVGFAVVYVVAKALRVPVELHDGHVDIQSKGRKEMSKSPKDETKEKEV